MSANTKVIEFRIKELNVDPAQYKPYSHTMVPYGMVLVQIPVEEEGIVEISEEEGVTVTVLNLEGYRAVLSTLADNMEAMHKARQNRKEAANQRW